MTGSYLKKTLQKQVFLTNNGGFHRQSSIRSNHFPKSQTKHSDQSKKIKENWHDKKKKKIITIVYPSGAITNIKETCIESKLCKNNSKLQNGASISTNETRFIQVIMNKKIIPKRK